MLPDYMPLRLGSTFLGKVPKASSKATYTTVFYHGDNLDQTDTSVLQFDSQTDNFAVQDKIIRLPRVVRFLIQSGQAGGSFAHYAALAESLATEFEEDGICFTWGRYTTQVAGMAWLHDTTPGLGLLTPSTVFAGRILTFAFIGQNTRYAMHEDPGFVPNALYIDGYDKFVANHPRHVAFRSHIWNNQFSSIFGDPGYNNKINFNDAMSGGADFGPLGPGLSTFGWDVTHIEWDVAANYVSESELRSKITDFFDL